MRLLYITNARIPTEKAHGLQIMKTLEALVERGEEVSLVVPKRKNPITEDPFRFYNLRVTFPVTYLARWLGPLESISEALYFPVLRFFFGLQAFFYARYARVDVIYTRDLLLAFFLSVLTRHQVLYEDHEPRRSNRALYLFFLRHIRRKVVVAENLTELYRESGVPEESYRIIPNGVDLIDFKKKEGRTTWARFDIDQASPVVLYVGSLYEWKGVYTLLRAAKEIPAEVVFIGSTGKEEFVVELAKEKAPNVYQIDFLPHAEVIGLMTQADVLVLPNTAHEERSERFTTPLKLFEYMASGVPIVASDIPSFRAYLRDDENAKLFQPDDSSDLAQAVKWVLSHPKEGSKLAQAARGGSLQYSWTKRAEKISQYIRA